MTENTNLELLAKKVGDDWKQHNNDWTLSPYYDEAEKHMAPQWE
jgi:hypothetical protein